MAGRGAKYPTSFNSEQMGLAKGDILPTSVLQPPLCYPLLEHKPLQPILTNEMDYLVELKRNIAEYMHESLNNVEMTADNEDFERYTDCYENMISTKLGYESRYDWSIIPMELKPCPKRKIRRSTGVIKKRKIENEVVSIKFDKKEDIQQDNKEEKNIKEDEAIEEKVDEYIEEKVDEEMDGGTDYVDNFFDNGEHYDDEDDNVDDGPVY